MFKQTYTATMKFCKRILSCWGKLLGKCFSIEYRLYRDAVDMVTTRVENQGTRKNVSDLFTNVLTAARRIFFGYLLLFNLGLLITPWF